MIVYGLVLFGLLWTSSDFFGPFFIFWTSWVYEGSLPMGDQQYKRPNRGIPSESQLARQTIDLL